MIRVSFLFAFVFVININGWAQVTDWNLYQSSEPDSVVDTIIKNHSHIITNTPNYDEPGVVLYYNDSTIEQLTEEFIENPPKVMGYRIQLFSGSNVEANSAYGGFIGQYSDVRAYKDWRSPNYVVTVGDFKTKLDAQKFLTKIKGYYSGAFLVKGEIQKMKL